MCVGWFPRLIPEMGPFQFPSPRGPVPICFGLGFSTRVRERGLLSPCGSLRPFPPSHLQARCLTTLLSVSLLGVSWLLILGAMSWSPFGKGMLPFNFSKKWFLSLSFSLSAPPSPNSFSVSFTCCCCCCCRHHHHIQSSAARTGTAEPTKLNLLSGQAPSPDTACREAAC